LSGSHKSPSLEFAPAAGSFFAHSLKDQTMIAPKIAAEIRRLLDTQTLSQRKIAAIVGVSRGTVGSFAAGRQRNESRSKIDEPSGPPTRCPGCGSLVYLPCLLCLARKERQQHRKRASTAYVSGDLDLRPEHRQRYEEVRRQRIATERTEGPMPDPVH
jgi:predicted XRE-type DNA-binding protein